MPIQCNINLDLFEGPLDLLYHLIRKNDLNLYDIPIALILDQFYGYLDVMKELDMDVAGEFILMASELSHIKSRLLLYQKIDEDEEGPDPRANLVVRLLEYQKYKRASTWLSSQPLLGRDVFKRPKEAPPQELQEEKLALKVEPFVLISVFREILKKAPKGAVHEIEAERISVTERIYQIVKFLETHDESVLFETLFEGNTTRSQIVMTFLAILEMARLRMIQIFQMDRWGSIWVKRVMVLEERV